MKKNMHPIDRSIRVVVGLTLASMAFWGPSNFWFLLGLVPALSGVVGWCPPYDLLGINTCNIGKKKE